MPKECLTNEANIERATEAFNQSKDALVITYDKLEQISIIKEFMKQFPELSANTRDVSDSFVLFVHQSRSFLVEFYQGCSRFWYGLDFDATLNFMEILKGVPT